MTDVLKRGPVTTDQAIVEEIADIFKLLDRSKGRLLSGNPARAIWFAGLLENAANRLLDMSDAIFARSLPPTEARQSSSVDDHAKDG